MVTKINVNNFARDRVESSSKLYNVFCRSHKEWHVGLISDIQHFTWEFENVPLLFTNAASECKRNFGKRLPHNIYTTSDVKLGALNRGIPVYFWSEKSLGTTKFGNSPVAVSGQWNFIFWNWIDSFLKQKYGPRGGSLLYLYLGK